jgi:transcriptional regulator with XRE-family HTH domain
MIHENIKKMRQIRHITQKELAEMMHVAQNTISAWETGRNEPNIGAIEELCRIFGCKKSDLLESDPDSLESDMVDFFIQKVKRKRDYYLKFSVDSFGETSATVLSKAPVRLSAYWAKILNQLSEDSLEKLSERAEELVELDNLKRNLEKKKDSE